MTLARGLMLTRRLATAACIAALALFCPACAVAPDRWSVTLRDQEEAKNNRWRASEVDVQLSGPIPGIPRHE